MSPIFIKFSPKVVVGTCRITQSYQLIKYQKKHMKYSEKIEVALPLRV